MPHGMALPPCQYHLQGLYLHHTGAENWILGTNPQQHEPPSHQKKTLWQMAAVAESIKLPSEETKKPICSYSMFFFVRFIPLAFSISASFSAFFLSNSACFKFSSCALRNNLTKFKRVAVTALIRNHFRFSPMFILAKRLDSNDFILYHETLIPPKSTSCPVSYLSLSTFSYLSHNSSNITTQVFLK